MTNTIRSKRTKDITMKALREGYVEQRAWLSVGMTRIIVSLEHDRTPIVPLVVRYLEVDAEGEAVKLVSKRFAKGALDEARILFKQAGNPARWPNV